MEGSGDDGRAEQIMMLALRLGDEMFVSGAETRTVETALLAVTARLGLRGLEADISARSIHLQYRPPGGPPLVMMRVTRTDDGKDLDRMGLVHRLVEEIVTGRTDAAGADRELDRIARVAGRWPWWVRVAGGAVLAAMICLQAGGTAAGALVSALLLVLVDRGGVLVSRTGLPGFYLVMAKAALAVGIGLLFFALGLSGQAVAGLVAANLVLLLPILSVVSLSEDAISGFTLMAAGRIVEVAMTLGALFVGVAIAGSLALDATDFEQDAYGVKFAQLPLVVALAAAAVGAAGNTLFNGGAARLLPVGVGAGLLTGAVNNLARSGLGLAAPLAVLLAAAVLGWAATHAGRRLRIPSTVLVIPGVTGALLPGPDVYLALVKYASGAAGASSALMGALITTAAIGVGVVLGNFVGTGRAGRTAAARLGMDAP
ncbi:threonine/serine exporter family protein [Actinomadura hibisca]|uniref:threonine/serine exporter family protein n=1 Tax=Actinomadura hibisca TaxID=68565 RepID=UPI00082CC7B2|nr:threonine/serine exporter family protein [Actinomadura hibisca]